MTRKNIIKSIVGILIVTLMVFIAEITGQMEVIFPEITAIAIGFFVAPAIPWKTSLIRIVVLIAICSIIGVLITNFMPVPKVVQMIIALLLSQSVLLFSKTSFVPIISASVLPVLLGTKSIVYPISAILLTFLIVLVFFIFSKTRLAKPLEYNAETNISKCELVEFVARVILSAIVITLALLVDLRYIVAPPLLVAFTEFTRTNNKARQKPIKAVILITLCGVIGCLVRLVINTKLNLPLTLCSFVIMILIIATMNYMKMFIPPAGALGILPLLIPENFILIYPLEILIGATVFMLLARLIFTDNIRKKINLSN